MALPIPNQPIRSAPVNLRNALFHTSLVAVCFLSLNPASARPTHKADPWIEAVTSRDHLELTPPGQRTPAAYESVLENFRRIYHADPAAAKAPAAVAAVADLLTEKGRLFHDQHALKAAIGQYEFLRQQYPNSPQVENALLLEGDICRQDLKDLACAKDKFQQILASSPGSSFAEQAAMELREIQPPPPGFSKSKRTRQQNQAKAQSSLSPSSAPSVPAQPQPARATSTEQAQDTSQPGPPIQPSLQPTSTSPAPDQTPQPTSTSRPIVQITGMRHWSNPTSTRIAIDLGGKVEYEAARVPNPDRIFFDLHGARLAPSLNGHSVEVIDDGYLKRIRAAQFHPNVTRVVLDVTDVSQYSAFLLPNPWRLIIDIHSDKGATRAAIAQSKLSSIGPSDTEEFSNLTPPQPTTPRPAPTGKSSSDSTIADVAKLSTEPAKIPATAGPTSSPMSAKVLPSTVPQPTSQNQLPQPATSSKTRKPARQNSNATADLPSNLPSAPLLPHAADPTSDGQRSLVRALGLKVGRIVIDAGHGGHDSGTLGPHGLEEKDVVLDVALRVGTLLHKRLGAEIVYTRDTDIFIPLETRTAIANKAQADLFLSIHANSSPEPSARGVETYYLNFTSDPNALDVAARENAVSSQSVHQLSDLVRQITLKDKIDESREFAADVDQGLYSGLKSGNPGLKDRGVKKAPFVVLIGAQMPSILAEISFLTNPEDAEQLQTGAYRQRIAEALVSGVERYLNGLSSTRPGVKPKNSANTISPPDQEPSGR